MTSLANFLNTKSSSVPSSSQPSNHLNSVSNLSSSGRKETQGTLKREGINPVLSATPRTQARVNDSQRIIHSVFLEKRRWISLGDGWHQITAHGSGSITRCGLYSVVESAGSTKTFSCIYIPRSEAAYNASMCDIPEYDLLLHAKIHYKQNVSSSPQFEVLIAYKDATNYLRIVCDAIAKSWLLVHHQAGRDSVMAQMIDPTIKSNLFYELLIQIRGNCLSLDVNGSPVFTKLRITSLNDLSGLMGLKATGSKFSVKGWKLKGLNAAKYRACIPATEETDHPHYHHLEEAGLQNQPYLRKEEETIPRTPVRSRSLSSFMTPTTPNARSDSFSAVPPSLPPPPPPFHTSSRTAMIPPIPSFPSSSTAAISRHSLSETPELTVENKPSAQSWSESNETKRRGFPPELLEELYTSTERAIAETILQDIVQRDLEAVKFEDIASLVDAKRILYEAIVLPTMMPEFFTGIREPWKGVLLYGPPGTGKTMLAKAVCSLQQSTFFNCSAASLISKYRGDSEKIVRCLFTAAKILAPSVIFIDEIDALVSSRGAHDQEHEASRRLKTELFCQIDGLSSNRGAHQIVLLAATNCPWDLDPAMRRRLEKRIYIPLPDLAARIELITILIKNLAVTEDFDIAGLARMTEGYSGADLQIALREASMMPVRRLLDTFTPDQIMELKRNGEITVPKVSMNDCLKALTNTRPSVSTSSLEKFLAWEKEFGNR